MTDDSHERTGLIEVAIGRRAASVAIVNARIASVQSGEIVEGTVALLGSRIAYVGPEEVRTGADTTVIDAAGRFVLPGYIEPHCHPFVAYNPDALARAFLCRGITTAVADTLFLQLHLETDTLLRLLVRLQEAPFTWFWAVRTTDQGGGGPRPFAGEDERLWSLPETIEVGEVTDWPAIIAAPALRKRLADAKNAGLKIDGHTAGARYANLQALVAAGVTACHEAITVDQALDRLRSGLYTILRHSSLRPDIAQWIELFQASPGLNWSRCMLTSDGSNPAWYSTVGGVDAMVAMLVDAGMPALTAISMATINPAQYFERDETLGMLAPGRFADIQIRSQWSGVPDVVLRRGAVVAREGHLVADWEEPSWEEYAFAKFPMTAEQLSHASLFAFAGKPAVPVGRFESTVIVRDDGLFETADAIPAGMVSARLFSRDGRQGVSMWIYGFADRLEGLATTFVESGSLLVIGRVPEAMALAASTVANAGGGLAVVHERRVSAFVDLSIDGKMSRSSFAELASQIQEATQAVRLTGYPFDELLYSLDFLTCDFLPTIRLLQDGVYNVKERRYCSQPECIDA